MRGVGEIKIATVMAETVIICIRVFRCRLVLCVVYVVGVLGGDVVDFIVMHGVFKQGACILSSDLDRYDACPVRECRRLMRGSKDFDVRSLLDVHDAYPCHEYVVDQYRESINFAGLVISLIFLWTYSE